MNGHLLELFRSWQGEGPYAGVRQIFVRTSGCHLRCVYCDTPDSWERSKTWSLEGEERPNPAEVSDLVAILRDWSSRERFHSVSFTGGEPLLQPEFVRALALESRASGLLTYLDTSGTRADALEKVVDAIDIVALDIKLPSTPGVRVDWEDVRRCVEVARGREAFVKIVVLQDSREDEVARAAGIVPPGMPVVLQLATAVNAATVPPDGAKIARLRAAFGREVSVLPQLHVLAGWK